MSMRDFIGCHVLIPDLWTICQPIEDLTITCYFWKNILWRVKTGKNFMKKENNFHLDWIVNFNTAEFQQMLKKKSTSIYTPFTVLVLKNQHLIETHVFLIVKLICCDWISWPFKPFIHCKDSYIYFIHLS